jgi:uncharacterized repeat protein (TIGR03833 family)
MINRLLEQFEEDLSAKADTPPSKEAQQRSAIKPGSKVAIIQKAHQRSGRITEGVVRQLLTSAAFHPRGIKVRLTSGEVGRVHHLLERAKTP